MGYQPRKPKRSRRGVSVENALKVFLRFCVWVGGQVRSVIRQFRMSPKEKQLKTLIEFLFDTHQAANRFRKSLDDTLKSKALQDVHKDKFGAFTDSHVWFNRIFYKKYGDDVTARFIILWPYIFCVTNQTDEIKSGALIHNVDFESTHRNCWRGEYIINHAVEGGYRDSLSEYRLRTLQEYLSHPDGKQRQKPSYLIEDADILDPDILIEVLQAYKDQFEVAYAARMREEEARQQELRTEEHEKQKKDRDLFVQQKASVASLLSESCMVPCPDCGHQFVVKKKDQSIAHIQCKSCDSILSYSAELQEVESVASGVVESVLVSE